MRRSALLWLAMMLSGCVTLGGSANSPSADQKNWLTYQVSLGGQVLRFSIPRGVNADFIDPAVQSQVDLENPATFAETGSAGILLRRWDYRQSAFSPILGTLTVSIGINYSEQPLSDPASLQAAVGRQRERVQQQAIARDPQYTGPPTPPVRFDPVKLAGRDALYVSFRFLHPAYVVPLDAHHYLGITVENGVAAGKWHDDAQAAADAFLKSIAIESK